MGESSNCVEERKKGMEEPLLEEDNRKGGLKALPFIIGNETFQNIASGGLGPNMTQYLMNQYHLQVSSVSTILSLWSAASNVSTLLGAIVADSFLGRFYTIGLGSIICLMGMILLWSTTIIPYARPPPCDNLSNATCSSPSVFQLLYLFMCFGLISIGTGGVGSSSLAFGADQLEKGHGGFANPGVKERYFGWYYASTTVSVLISVTLLVYIQDNLGWRIGYAVPIMFMLVSVILFFLASSSYVKLQSKKNLVIGLVQVVVASCRKRHMKLSVSTDNVWHRESRSTVMFPSPKLRFLNKACMVRDPAQELSDDGKATDSWSLCTIDQVEELKALIRVIPIWSTGVVMSINISQNSIPFLQAAAMDRRILSFTVPAASFGMFFILAVIIWVALYDRVFLPLASRLKGRHVQLSPMTRMGMGIFLAILSTLVSAGVEGARRRRANKQENMSALWLLPHSCLLGPALASNIIAQNEFYFSELPRSMLSFASTLNGIGVAVASIIMSLLINVVDTLSKAGGSSESWVASDINKGHYDYYYLVLTGINAANMIYFVICCRAYGPLKEVRKSCEQPDESHEC